MHENSCSYKQWFKRHGFLKTVNVFLLHEVWHVLIFMFIFRCTTIYMIRIFTINTYGESFTNWGLMLWSFKMKTPCMPIHPWIRKISQDNLIMIKIIQGWNDIENNFVSVRCNGNLLISCVIGLGERFQLPMASTNIGMFFFTKANLCCYINFLWMKNVNAAKPSIV
jgi:hypothetical protein